LNKRKKKHFVIANNLAHRIIVGAKIMERNAIVNAKSVKEIVKTAMHSEKKLKKIQTNKKHLIYSLII
jgi:hypothetical protein